MGPFATVADLEARWRPLTEAEKIKAVALIDDATAFIGSQIDAVDENNKDESVRLRAVCCSCVKRQMMSSGIAYVDGQEPQPMKQFTQTGGPYSFSGSPANPSGDMYLTQSEKTLLGIGVGAAYFIVPSIEGDYQ